MRIPFVHWTRNKEIDHIETISKDKPETIIAVSDVHLGYGDQEDQNGPHSNYDGFAGFLKQLGEEIDCDHLVICGDFLDLWRRDLLGVVIENTDMLNLLREVREKSIQLHFVVGNHDYHLRKFDWNIDRSDVDLQFHKGLKLIDSSTSQNIEYTFLHGDEFDKWQFKMLYDFLCMSNDFSGDLMEDVWQKYLRKTKRLGRIITYIIGNVWKRKARGKIMDPTGRKYLPAEDRFSDIVHILAECKKEGLNPRKRLPDLEKQAFKYAEKKGPLIFGHTHLPFVWHGKNSVANTGSWVFDSKKTKVTNSYLAIKQGTMELYSYSQGESKRLATLEF